MGIFFFQFKPKDWKQPQNNAIQGLESTTEQFNAIELPPIHNGPQHKTEINITIRTPSHYKQLASQVESTVKSNDICASGTYNVLDLV